MGVELASSHQPIFPDMDDINFSDSYCVYHVKRALKAAVEGDCDDYTMLVAHMNREKLGPDEVAMIETCSKALTGAVSYLSFGHHGSLLDAIKGKGRSLWNCRTEVIDALLELVSSMATTSSEKFLDWCLDMLVSNFVPPTPEFLKQPRGVAKKDQVLDRLHSTLKDIACLLPLFPMKLAEKTIKPNICHMNEPELVIYVENMLRLESGAIGEFVGRKMLLAIVDVLIDLDVNIPLKDNPQDDFAEGIHNMELEDLEEPEVNSQQDGHEKSNETAKKLDSLLVLTFEHLKTCYENGRLVQVFETLLQSFQRTIFATYKSKFTQFVMFYACSLDPENCGKRFTDTLQHIFVSSPYPEWRMSAVAYLASYLSRAKFASASCVATIMESLVNWCSEYCKNQNNGIKIFYSCCQAIMYVLCFRMRWTIFESQLLMDIEDILRHPLNPLKVCLPSIVEEFLRLVRATRLLTLPDTMEFDGLLESELSRAFGGVERLDMFFPFDPCLLKKSERFIRPNYVHWSMVRNTYDDYDNDDDETTSDEDVAEADEVENGMDIPDGGFRSYDEHDYDLDVFDYSLDKMSITPQNSPLSHRFGGALHKRMQMPSRLRPSTSPESL